MVIISVNIGNHGLAQVALQYVDEAMPMLIRGTRGLFAVNAVTLLAN